MGKKRLWIQVLISAPILIYSLGRFGRFANVIETRPGVSFVDPVLAWIPPADHTWIIFAIIYPSILLGLLMNAKRPDRLVMFMQTYTVMLFFRTLAMWLTPLDAPPGLILLKDPLVEFFSTDKALTKDLFFSGHTSSMFIVFLTLAGKKTKPFFFLGMFVVMTLILWQHVHYTVDILAALFFTYGCYRIVVNFQRKFFKLELG